MTFGTITNVEQRPLGSSLVVDSLTGATTLTVEMTSDFDEDGGQLSLAGVVLDYTAMDSDTGIITLAAPLTFDAVTDDPVLVVESGQVSVEWIANVATDEGDTIPAIIPTPLIAYFPEGSPTDNTAVEIGLRDGVYEVQSQPQTTPTFGSDISITSDTGTDLIRAGEMTYGKGLAIARDDGTPAFVVARAFSNSPVQTWGLFDRNGIAVVSEDPLTDGLSRPRLEHPFQPVSTTSGTAVTCGPYGWERTTTSTAYETLFAYDGRHQNAFVDFKFAAFCSDATTAGDIRVVNLFTGAVLDTFIGVPWVATIPAGSTSYTIVDPAPQAARLPGAVDDYIRLGVQVRRTAGTGVITMAVPLAMGG